jgi:hypothetical protein
VARRWVLGLLAVAGGAAVGASLALASTTHNLTGTWSCCGSGGAAAQTWNVTAMDLSSGSFSGNGSGGGFTFPITGTATGDTVKLTTGPYNELPGYSATFSGTISASSNAMSGTWTSSQGQSGTWSSTLTSGASSGGTSLPANVVTSHTVTSTGGIVLGLQAPEAGTFDATATIRSRGARAHGGSTKHGLVARKVVYGTGTVTASAPGPVSLTITPTPAGSSALRRKGHLSVSVHLAFRSSAHLGSTVRTKDLRIRVHKTTKK